MGFGPSDMEHGPVAESVGFSASLHIVFITDRERLNPGEAMCRIPGTACAVEASGRGAGQGILPMDFAVRARIGGRE